MQERIQQLLNRVLEWWNKFTAKQKTLIIAAAAGAVMAIVILLTVLNQTKYVLLLNCADTKESAEVTALLNAESIKYRTSNDSLRIEVDQSMEANANMLLGANDIQSAAYSIEEVFSGGISQTEADKQRKYQVYMEKKLANETIATLDAVKTAKVDLHLPESDGTLLSKEEEASAFIMLGLEGEFTTDQAASLAKGIAVALGNKTPQNIEIMDTQGNTLFSGDDTYNVAGSANNQLSVKQKFESMVQNDVKKVLQGTGDFNKIEVACSLSIDFSSSQWTNHRYYLEPGQTQGYYTHSETYDAESTNGVAGVPGTDSNGETSYQYQDNTNSSSTEAETLYDYALNEEIETKDIPPGLIGFAQSSLSFTGIAYDIIRQEDVEASGDLDGITWEQYKETNKDKDKLEVDPELYQVIANASGIPADRITILAYQEPVFMDAEGLNIVPSDIIQLVLIIIIVALLAFVVLRSMRTVREVEQEEELSVESLLQSQPELELEDISIDEGSEAKRLIDKFVEDNPEAAAALLRNWLNEDWA